MKHLSLLFSFFLLSSCVQVNNESKQVIDKKEKTLSLFAGEWKTEDEFYTIYHLQNRHIHLCSERPDVNDTTIELCIPAAFTLLDNGNIDGVFIIDGKVIRPAVNHHLGGGLLILDGKASVIGTHDGKLVNDSLLAIITSQKGSFFQQIQLVRDGDALEFHKDQKLFQCRAVAFFADGQVGVVESKNEITLQEFASDLVRMKVLQAIYTDMGSYDEGWVRDPATMRPATIGKNRSQTRNQSNWLIFKSN